MKARAGAAKGAAGASRPMQPEAGIAVDPAFEKMPGHLIRRMHQLSVALFEAEMAAAGFDLTPVQFAALAAIARRPGSDQATIAQAIAYDPVTIGGVLQRLEAKGVVRREIAERDRRARRLAIEPAGQALLERAGPVVRALQDRIVAGLDGAERVMLAALLEKALAAAPDRPRAIPRAE